MAKKILLHCPIPQDATSFYRGFGPFNHLAKNHGIELIQANQGFDFSWHVLQNIDIVFLQRPSTPECLQILHRAKQNLKPVWIDYDDDYLKIPQTNPRHDLYADTTRQAYIRECVSLADVITVSTEAIKNTLEEILSPKAKIIVVPNAMDETLFAPVDSEQTKTILWRGGDTHVKDVEPYKDAILTVFDRFPEYKWVFYGHKFDWMTEHANAMSQHNRIQTYEFTNIMDYFHNLMQIRPEITIVPLENIPFNCAKSSISWIENTCAGATVMAAALPEFTKAAGCLTFENEKEFIETFTLLAENPSIRKNQWSISKENIPTLKKVNVTRLAIVDGLSCKETYLSPKVTEPERWGDRKFFEHALLWGFIQENEHYKKAHHDVADWLVTKLSPETMIEFGCGPGAILERFLMSNVESNGLEMNDYFIDYFQTRNPVFSDRIIKCDFAVDDSNELTIDKTDLGISIEVFEHINKSEAWWNAFITKLSENMKYFYFTSTPNHSTVEFDQQWGHVNVRQTESWIKLFECNGWRLIEQPKKICSWDLLFESTYNPNKQITQNPSFEKLQITKEYQLE